MSETAEAEFVSRKSHDSAVDDVAKEFFERARDEERGEVEPVAEEAVPEEAVPEETQSEEFPQDVHEEEATAETGEPEEIADPGDQEGESIVDVVVDGQTLEIPLSELVAGYHRERDYTRKTQTVAQERRQVEEYAKGLQTEQAEAVQRMNAIAQQLQAELVNHQEDPRELEALRVQNPGEYAARLQDTQRRQQLMSIAQQEQAAITERHRQEQIPRAIAELRAAEPAFAENFDSTYDQVGRWITSPSGGAISVEEWGRTTDPRQVLIAYKAMKADEQNLAAREARPRLRKKLSTMPKVRAGSPVDPGQREQSAYADSLTALKNDSSLDAVASAFMRREELKRTR